MLMYLTLGTVAFVWFATYCVLRHHEERDRLRDVRRSIFDPYPWTSPRSGRTGSAGESSIRRR